MKRLTLCTLFGPEKFLIEGFPLKVKTESYYCISDLIHVNATERKKFIGLLSEYQLSIVRYQRQQKNSGIK